MANRTKLRKDLDQAVDKFDFLLKYSSEKPPELAFTKTDFWNKQKEVDQNLPRTTAYHRFDRLVQQGEFIEWGKYKQSRYFLTKRDYEKIHKHSE